MAIELDHPLHGKQSIARPVKWLSPGDKRVTERSRFVGAPREAVAHVAARLNELTENQHIVGFSMVWDGEHTHHFICEFEYDELGEDPLLSVQPDLADILKDWGA